MIPKKIAIIGSGISGLECASRLKKADLFEIKIFEASNNFGGRIKNKTDFCDFPIELGANEIHGMNSYYHDGILKNGGKLLEYWDLDKIYIHYKPNENSTPNNYGHKYPNLERVNEAVKKYKEIEFIVDLFEEITYDVSDDSKKIFPNISLYDYLKSNNIPEKCYFYLDAVIGTECGTDIKHTSISGYSKICSQFTSGTENFVLINMSHYDVLEKLYEDIIKNDFILYETQITKIDYTDKNQILLKDSKGNEYHFDKCIITVPLSQYNKIKFLPNLSDEKIKSLNNIRYDSFAKLFLRFSKRLWPEDAIVILIPGCANYYEVTSCVKSINNFVLNCLISGENCKRLTEIYKVDKDKFLCEIFNDFEKVFGENARDFLEDYFWFDWEEQPFIEMGYTFIGTEEKENDREILRKQIENRIYFAGEAFGKGGHIATIHGAQESAFDLCDHIINCEKIFDK